jgi:hypothetical protein
VESNLGDQLWATDDGPIKIIVDIVNVLILGEKAIQKNVGSNNLQEHVFLTLYIFKVVI